MNVEKKDDPLDSTLVDILEWRVSETIKKYRTLNEAHIVTGLSIGQLKRYKAMKTPEPAFKPVVAMAIDRGIDLNWLATGKGDMMLKKNQMLNARSQQHKYLLEALLLTEQALEGVPHGLSPTKKVELVENVAEILKTDTQASNEIKPHLIQVVKMLAFTHINQVEE